MGNEKDSLSLSYEAMDASNMNENTHRSEGWCIPGLMIVESK